MPQVRSLLAACFATLALHCGRHAEAPPRAVAGEASPAFTRERTPVAKLDLEKMESDLSPLVSEVRELPFRARVPLIAVEDDEFERVLTRERDITNDGVKATESPELAIYDHRTKRVYLRARLSAEVGTLKTVIAHELTHALQDQHFDLGKKWLTVRQTPDALLAFRALLEGDATVTQAGVAARLGQRPASRTMKALRDEKARTVEELVASGVVDPTALTQNRAGIFFAYEEGQRFAATLYAEGGMAQVNEAFRAVPRGTWEISHPLSYLKGLSAKFPLRLSKPGKEALDLEMGPALFPTFIERYCKAQIDDAAQFGTARAQVWMTGPADSEVVLLRLRLDDDAKKEASDSLVSICRDTVKAPPTSEVLVGVRRRNELHIAAAKTRALANAVLAESLQRPFVDAGDVTDAPRRHAPPFIQNHERKNSDVHFDPTGSMTDDWAGVAATFSGADSAETFGDGGVGFSSKSRHVSTSISVIDAAATAEAANLYFSTFRSGFSESSDRTLEFAGTPRTLVSPLGKGLALDAFSKHEGNTLLVRLNVLPACGGRQSLFYTELWTTDEGRAILDAWAASMKRTNEGTACKDLDEALQFEKQRASATKQTAIAP